MSILTKDVWALSEDDFPRGDALDNQLGFLLRYAILAPSTKNSQPWAFSIQGNRIHLIADLTRSQALADPDKRELYISLGCALENLLVAAEHFGLQHAVSGPRGRDRPCHPHTSQRQQRVPASPRT